MQMSASAGVPSRASVLVCGAFFGGVFVPVVICVPRLCQVFRVWPVFAVSSSMPKPPVVIYL